MGLGSCWTPGPPALLLFPQTQILRGGPGPGVRGGVQGSLSSTPASRGAPPPVPPVPIVQRGPARPSTPHSIIPSSLPVRSRQVVLTLMTPEGTTGVRTVPVRRGRGGPWTSSQHLPSLLPGAGTRPLCSLPHQVSIFIWRSHGSWPGRGSRVRGAGRRAVSGSVLPGETAHLSSPAHLSLLGTPRGMPRSPASCAGWVSEKARNLVPAAGAHASVVQTPRVAREVGVACAWAELRNVGGPPSGPELPMWGFAPHPPQPSCRPTLA